MKSVTACAVVLFVLFLPACSSQRDMSEIVVGEKNTISWDDAKSIIRDSDAKDILVVSQNHAREVGITMKDGTQYETVEPSIDDLFDVLKRCGKEGKVSCLTE